MFFKNLISNNEDGIARSKTELADYFTEVMNSFWEKTCYFRLLEDLSNVM